MILTFARNGNDTAIPPFTACTGARLSAWADRTSHHVGRVVRAWPGARPAFDRDAVPAALANALVEADAACFVPE
jgi:hypothetical protein